MKKKVFWYHYHKQNSIKAGKPILTLHYEGICHTIENIVCNVPTFGFIRKEQPRFVVKGKGNVKFENNIAYIS